MKREYIIALRLSRKELEYIYKAWRKLRIAENRSDVIRLLMKIGYAVIEGIDLELKPGTTIRVENPIVSIKLPKTKTSLNLKLLKKALEKARAALEHIAKGRIDTGQTLLEEAVIMIESTVWLSEYVEGEPSP